MLSRHALVSTGIIFSLLAFSSTWAQDAQAPQSTESDAQIIARVDNLAKWQPMPTFAKVREIPNELKHSNGCDLTPDGKFLAVAGYVRVAIWNVETGERVARFSPKGPGRPDCLAISDDGKWVAYGTKAGVTLFDAQADKIVRKLDQLTEQITSIHFTADGRQVFVSDSSGRVMIVDLVDSDEEPVVEPPPAEDIKDSAIATLPDGRRLLVYAQSDAYVYQFMDADGFKRDLKKSQVTACLVSAGTDRFIIGRDDSFETTTSWTKEDIIFHTRSLLGWVTDARFTGDEKFLWLLGPYSISFRSIETTYLDVHAKLPTEAIGSRYLLIAPDARLLVAVNEDKFQIWRVEGDLFNPEKQVSVVLQNLVQQERFELLNQLGNQWADRHEFFDNGRGDSPYSYLCMKVQLSSIAGGERADQAKYYEDYLQDHPDNTLIRIVLFNIYNEMAFEVRGEGFAGGVTEEGWNGFYANMEKAWTALSPVLKQEKFPPETMVCAVLFARNTQQDKQLAEKIITRALAECPRYSRIFKQEAFARLPRWGGELQDSEKLAARVADTIGGKDGDRAYAEIADHLFSAVHFQHLIDHFGFDDERIMQGYLHWNDVSQDDQVANAALLFAVNMKDGAAAKEIYKRFEDRRFTPNNDDWGFRSGAFRTIPDWITFHAKPDKNPFSLPPSDEEE